jgi:ATP synthase protein I|tara:strand:+ start:1017 stop:1445 length:429 start_codon:yes stop_codon:yes gene_type:complete
VGIAKKKVGSEGSSAEGVRSTKLRYSPIRQIILVQLIATFFASASLLLFGWVAAYSALLGGLICVLPNAFLAHRVTRTKGLTREQKIGRWMQGETGKIIQSGIMFALVFIWIEPLNALLLFATFIGIQLLHYLVPAVTRYTK